MEWNHCLVLLSVFWTQVYCGGKIWLKLVNFSNSRGKGANNHYCDGKYFIRGSDCDHRFILCLDDTNGPQITSVCKYGRVRTSTIFNTNYITFGSKIGGTPNPMTFSFNTWRGTCKLKVDIYDDDDNADDYVDFVSTYYYQFMPGYNESTATATTVTMKHRITLTVQLKVYCDPDYYGMQCSTYCNQSEKYRCEAFTGQKICLGDWTGPDCNVKKDACMSGPCQNEGTCHNSFGSYLCVCKPGYTGNQCQQDVDECASLPCRNNGTCVDLLNHYQCTCPYGYSSKDCSSVLDLCNNNPCLNNGSCRMDQNNAMFHCDCTEEWEGHLCGSDVNECENEICQNNSTCENTQGGFHCHCADGWTGVKCQNDIDECLIMSCFGNSSCHNTNGSFFCACAEGYTGHLCEIDMDECMSSPCLNGGICHDEVNGFTCECARGYTGVTCKEEIDECAGNPCLNNGTCFDLVGSFLCYCSVGWTGELCDLDIDECNSSPCRNQGMCVNTNGSFHCHCSNNWNGPFCQNDVNECETVGCANAGECSNFDGGFRCTCSDGFYGERCDKDLDECIFYPCANGSTCINTFGSHQCTCMEGYTGNDCSENMNECASSPCFGNATCIDEIGHFLCECPNYFEGRTCADKIDPCETIKCLNDGTCLSSDNTYSCYCKTGFSGTFCQDKVLTNLLVIGRETQCKGTNDKILIYMDGIIKSEDQDRILDKIKLVIQKYGDLDIGVVDLRGNTERLEDTKGKTVTRLSLSLLLNGSTICGESLDALKGLLKLDENEFPYVFYHGDIANFKANPVVKKQKMTQKTWFKDKWYMVLAVVGSIFIIAGVLFVILRHKRKKQRALVNGQLSMNNSIQWHSENSTHSTLPPLSFDNDLYQSAHQSYQPQMTFEQKSIEASDTMIDSLQPSSAFENELYQTTIPHEQARLMYDFECFDDN